MATTPPARSRRSARSHEAVLTAAVAVADRRGYQAAAIEEIAAEAGVAKQTIYRWWPSKVDILLDPRREGEREMLRRGITSGELPAGLDVDAALDALCGPVVYRGLTGTPIPQSFIDGLIAGVLERRRTSG
jgi:hypothetical protein